MSIRSGGSSDGATGVAGGSAQTRVAVNVASLPLTVNS